MTEQDNLETMIATLINRRSEGAHWDFKRCHHQKKSDFIHDVLCLANANHRGNRYLIFGVENEDFSLHSICDDTGRRTQANIAGLFRDNAEKFFQSRFPEIYLEELKVDDTLLDVLVIKDAPHKPYYLVKKIENIVPHHIYTRVCDTNTPVKDTAQPHEIERMWRERFGLDIPPLERVRIYLNEPDEWSEDTRLEGNLNIHHKTFPEFTLRVANAEDYMACHEEWTRGEIRNNNNHAGYYEIFYHQTCLARVRYVSFDDNKKSMVAPNWIARGAGRFYYYDADSINYAIQKFNSGLDNEDYSTTLTIRHRDEAGKQARLRWGHKLKIPVLHPGEMEDFRGTSFDVELVEPSSDKTEQYDLFLRNQLEFEDWRYSLE